MPHLLLNLYRVPEDEAAGVRKLLDQHRIDWYETQPSFWGISHGGIWVRDEAEIDKARRLFHAYEAERSQRMRSEYAAARAAGTAPTLWGVVRAQPLQVLLAVLAALFALALVVVPVWLLF